MASIGRRLRTELFCVSVLVVFALSCGGTPNKDYINKLSFPLSFAQAKPFLDEPNSSAGTVVFWPFGVKGGGHPEGHPGWDFYAQAGTDLIAVAAGTVKAVGACDAPGSPCGLQGQYIILDLEGASIQVTYQHAGSVSVSAGKKVAQGEAIGKISALVANDPLPVVHIDLANSKSAKICPTEYLSDEAKSELAYYLSKSINLSDSVEYGARNGPYSSSCF